jgi:hypothetical protein
MDLQNFGACVMKTAGISFQPSFRRTSSVKVASVIAVTIATAERIFVTLVLKR